MAGEYTSLFGMYNQRVGSAKDALSQSEQQLNSAKSQYIQNQQDYISGVRNPVADLIKKPERDVTREKRLKDVAKWGLIADAIGLIGKGWAASKGVKPLPTEGKATFQALGKLEKLDQLYRQEGYRYDQHRISEALRRQQAGDILEQFKLASAEQDYKQNQQRLNNAQQNADAMTLRKEEQQRQDQLIKEDREYQSGVRRESYAQQDKANAREFNRQIELMNHKSLMSGRNGEFEPPVKNISLVTKNPKTGKFEPMVDGEFTEYLSAAIKENPKLQENELFDKNTNEYNTNAKMIVIDYLARKGIQAQAAQRTHTREEARLIRPNSTDAEIDAWAKINGIIIK